MVVLPTKEECERISTSTCKAEFSLAVFFQLDDLLPDCNKLPGSIDKTSTFMELNHSPLHELHLIFIALKLLYYVYSAPGGSGSQSDGLLISSNPNVTCSADFYLENSTCFPICQEWTRFSQTEHTLLVGSAAGASVLGIIGGLGVIVGSIVRYKSMWVGVWISNSFICVCHAVHVYP